MSEKQNDLGGLIEKEIVQTPVQNAEVYDSYANQIRMGVTLSDFTLIFGVIVDRGKAGSVNCDKCIVRLAPTTFKQLHLQMSAALAAYEQSIGEIPTPKNLVGMGEKIQTVLSKNLKEQFS